MILISDAAKKVEVETHVLRYWEEELKLPIKRNEQGHRYYTEEDVERFKQIKKLKEQGLQLKAINNVLNGGKRSVSVGRVRNERKEEGERKEGYEVMVKRMPESSRDCVPAERETEIVIGESREEKAERLQWLLKQLFKEVLKENNEVLAQEIKESVIKELDYQFRMQDERNDEREEERNKRDEEHYKRIDELLRKKRRLIKNRKDGH